MTKEQIVAVRAMMYAFDRYGAKRLIESSYAINPFTENEVRIGFGEAYNICQEMVDAESKESEKCIWIKYDYRTICPKECGGENPYWRIPENMENLKYCPYCGREIEVQE